VELEFLSDYANAVENINRGNYHFIALTGMDYVDLRRNVSLSPVMVLSKMEEPTEPLLLIIRKGESLDSIGRKPNSMLMLEAGRVGATARMWLETVLWEQGVKAGIRHFSEILYVQKASRIVLPVFFGKADACVIAASAFELMTDLNPQLGRQLKVEKTSEPLVLMLICATLLADPEDKVIMAREAEEALVDPYTRQALTIVQMKQFFPSKPEYLASTEALFERYQRMVGGYESSLPADTKAQ
jgi:ABC-type phosphate/phosphonate transport system substrate-binding protein